MKIQYEEKIIDVKEPMSIRKILKDEIKEKKDQVIAAIFNNTYVNLEYEVCEDGKIELIYIDSKEGMKVYTRTLTYILGKAFDKIFPNKKMEVNYHLSNSMFCEMKEEIITDEQIKALEKEMKEIVEKDLPIKQIIMTREEAEKFFEEHRMSSGRLQLDLKENPKIYMYKCEDFYSYCYGTMADRTGIIKVFDLVKFNDGFLVRYPSSSDTNTLVDVMQSKKIAWAMDEYEDIHRILNVDRVYKLNKAIEEGRIKDVIMLAEALHEKKIANIADNIAKRKDVKMVLIAGPSSSGKTTFAQRLGIQLKLNMLKPVTISVDNYFVERKDNPKDENGDYDFETIDAIDLKLFNSHLNKLLNGEEIEMPEFDFKVGKKVYMMRY